MKRMTLVFATLAAMAIGVIVGQRMMTTAKADGIPATDPLFYSGLVLDGASPATGSKNILIKFFDAAGDV